MNTTELHVVLEIVHDIIDDEYERRVQQGMHPQWFYPSCLLLEIRKQLEACNNHET